MELDSKMDTSLFRTVKIHCRISESSDQYFAVSGGVLTAVQIWITTFYRPPPPVAVVVVVGSPPSTAAVDGVAHFRAGAAPPGEFNYVRLITRGPAAVPAADGSNSLDADNNLIKSPNTSRDCIIPHGYGGSGAATGVDERGGYEASYPAAY